MSMAQLNRGLGPFHCRAPNKKLWRLSAFWPQLVTAVDSSMCIQYASKQKKPALPLCPTFGTAPPSLEADWLKCIKGFFQSLKPYHLLSFNSFNHNKTECLIGLQKLLPKTERSNCIQTFKARTVSFNAFRSWNKVSAMRGSNPRSWRTVSHLVYFRWAVTQTLVTLHSVNRDPYNGLW